MATTLEQKIDQLLGRLDMSGGGGGVMSLLDTPTNQVQDAHRERYLMDMFSGKNPDTGESFLEPTVSATSEKMKMLEMRARQAGMSVQEFIESGGGARGLGTPAMRDALIKYGMDKDMSAYDLVTSGKATSANLGFSGERGFETPAMRDNAQAVMSRLSEAEYRDVMEILPQLSGEQYRAFIAGLENGSINPSGYEVQNQDRLRMY